MIRAITSARGKPAIEDKNHFRYTANGGNTEVSWFRCKDRKCKATLTTRKSTNELVGQSLPQHNHGNGLMKAKVRAIESAVVDKYAAASGSTATAALQEISVNILNSDCPGMLSSASSASAIKAALWRQKQKLSPRPNILLTITL